MPSSNNRLTSSILHSILIRDKQSIVLGHPGRESLLRCLCKWIIQIARVGNRLLIPEIARCGSVCSLTSFNFRQLCISWWRCTKISRWDVTRLVSERSLFGSLDSLHIQILDITGAWWIEKGLIGLLQGICEGEEIIILNSERYWTSATNSTWGWWSHINIINSLHKALTDSQVISNKFTIGPPS